MTSLSLPTRRSAHSRSRASPPASRPAQVADVRLDLGVLVEEGAQLGQGAGRAGVRGVGQGAQAAPEGLHVSGPTAASATLRGAHSPVAVAVRLDRNAQ